VWLKKESIDRFRIRARQMLDQDLISYAQKEKKQNGNKDLVLWMNGGLEQGFEPKHLVLMNENHE